MNIKALESNKYVVGLAMPFFHNKTTKTMLNGKGRSFRKKWDEIRIYGYWSRLICGQISILVEFIRIFPPLVERLTMLSKMLKRRI